MTVEMLAVKSVSMKFAMGKSVTVKFAGAKPAVGKSSKSPVKSTSRAMEPARMKSTSPAMEPARMKSADTAVETVGMEPATYTAAVRPCVGGTGPEERRGQQQRS